MKPFAKNSILIISVATLTGCSNQLFQPIGKPATSQSLQTQGADTTTYENKIETSKGVLSWNSQTLSNSDQEFSASLKVPFGRVYKSASKVIRFMTPYACQYISSVKSSPLSEYSPDEVPCGEIVDSQWKHLMDINIPQYSETESGFKVKVGAVTLPIMLSRNTYQGQFAEENLDSKTNEIRQSAIKFAEDISIKYLPENQAGSLQLCLNIPGADISSPQQKISAKASKSILGADISHEGDFKVTPGTATFDYGRACFSAGYDLRNVTQPTLKFSTVTAPYLSNVQHTGLNIQLEDWFLKVLDKLLSFFNFSIRESILSQAQDLSDSSIEDVESGKWFAKIHGDALLKKTGERFNKSVAKVLGRVGVPTHQAELKNLLHDGCRLEKFAASTKWTARLEAFCSQYIDQIKIEIMPFAIDEESKQQGCYSYYANIHQTEDSAGKEKWWSKKCHFAAKFKITLPAAISTYQAELEELMKTFISEERIPQDWLNELQNANAEEYLLDLVLEELEKRGINQLQNSDWVNTIPTILNEVLVNLNNQLN